MSAINRGSIHDPLARSPESGQPSLTRMLAGDQLLFGVVALQNNSITREQLVAGFKTWVQDKSRTLAEILQSQGVLSPQDCEFLNRLVEKLREKHGGNAERGLVALKMLPQVVPELDKLNDPDLQASLNSVGRKAVAKPAINNIEEPAVAKFDPLAATATYEQPPDEVTFAKLPLSIGRYRVDRLLGQGGFGVVYLAYDEQLKRPVAVKVPHSRLLSRANAVEAYLAEARTVANLDHRHIVPVHDVGSSDEYPCYVVSKYVAGTDLASRLRRLRPSPLETCELTAMIAEALHYAHTHGVVHRDIKPGNILLDKEGVPYVVDFGLALREQDLGKGPRFAGTPAYMSPEQARGEGHRVDGRSDIYSLGVVIYETLLDRRPFQGTSVDELLEQIATREPTPPSEIDQSIPRELERICLKAMAKRANDRYATGLDLAVDLRHFVSQHTKGDLQSRLSRRIVDKSGASDTRVAGNTPTGNSLSTHPASKIIPKGLRSFDEHDADFFIELLPGPRDREGLPESLRFWKTRIEDLDPTSTFSIGLIYGPSGCGKSSLVKAGLLPRLARTVITVYLEATGEQTETRLLTRLQRYCPALPADLSLKDTLAALRLGQGIPVGRKVLIVLDQFEQWLHVRMERQETELVQALRQCDGGQVQCLVMVRDDFWMAATRFMRDVEIELSPGHNTASVDRFDLDHSRKVLAAFGSAYGRLAGSSSDSGKAQNEFLKLAVAGLAQEGMVICLQLALFAEMMKERAWTPAALNEVGGTAGVGVTFLEETFSSLKAHPRHRVHENAARAVLKSLLPESGADIKRHAQSYEELLESSGYSSRPGDFDELICILDSEIRLITPTDPVASGTDAGRSPHAPTGLNCYQLTHDYLVPSLREWLTRKQKETRRGRAELLLADRAATWDIKPEDRHLPSLLEYLTIRRWTGRNRWSGPQRKMMRRAAQVLTTRWGSTFLILLVISFSISHVWSKQLMSSLHAQVQTAVDAIQNTRGAGVVYALRELDNLPRELVQSELQLRYGSAVDSRKTGLAYALANLGRVDCEFLCSRIESLATDEVDNLATALREARDDSLRTIGIAVAAIQTGQDWRLKARLAITALHLGDDTIAADMCRIDGRHDPVQRTIFIDELSSWHGDLTRLATVAGTASDAPCRSAICLALAGISLDRLTAGEQETWKAILSKWYESAPDSGTHSASGLALRSWETELPQIPSLSLPGSHRDWYFNRLGITMIRIRAGRFFRARQEAPDSDFQTVTVTQDYFLGDREVSLGQFQQFVADGDCPSAEKPKDWNGSHGTASPTPAHPVQQVSWYDAVLFCNWLSRKEGLSLCYERTGEHEKSIFGQREYDGWRLIAGATGYRLPTEPQWEHASRAGTSTLFAFGNEEELMSRYVVFQGRRAEPCASRLPNGWGLFDMHGNVWEWCDSLDERLGGDDFQDSTLDSKRPQRVYRGGGWLGDAADCQSRNRQKLDPSIRSMDLGFRVARVVSPIE